MALDTFAGLSRRRPTTRLAGTPVSPAAPRTDSTCRPVEDGIDRRVPVSPSQPVVSPYLRTYTPLAVSASPAAPERRSRRRRSRRPEVAIAAIVLVLLALGVRQLWVRPASSAPVLAGDASAAPGQSRLAGPSKPIGTPRAPVATPLPIAFSFAKFEADPALVAGAASSGVPTLSGESAIVVDVNSKEVIYAKQPRKRLLVASTTKIMTAIVAVERSAVDKVITVPVEATQVEPNHMGIRAGEKLSLEELLYGLMLDSGNDAAEAIAYGVGGAGPAGRAQFIKWMNDKVVALGLADTRFANPSGFDDPNQYSSAYDLAVIGAYALGKPELRKIFGTKDIVIQPSKESGRDHGWFNPGNLNSLLWSYRGAIGIKPGYTEDAGYTLVAAAEREGRTLVAVTLNSRRHFSDCALLFDFGFDRK
ncbi:MAG: hypothetical protein HY332_24120 [Chloroflexi bacterium]|nr:hypothetical protein [Chloroflexota bacterium]